MAYILSHTAHRVRRDIYNINFLIWPTAHHTTRTVSTTIPRTDCTQERRRELSSRQLCLISQVFADVRLVEGDDSLRVELAHLGR